MRTPPSEQAWDRLAVLVALAALLTLALLNVRHTVLAVPFENDFSVLAARSDSLRGALTVDGFWPAGYPVLLWLARQLVPDALAAGKLLAALLAFGLALAGYRLLRALVAPGVALLAQVALVLNWYFVRPSLFLGSDLPFALLTVIALWLAVRGLQAHEARWLTAAGAVSGLSFLLRFPGALFPVVLVLVFMIGQPLPGGPRSNGRAALWVVIAFLLLASPQLILNGMQTGNPLFSTQAKNIWFGVYGEGDWRTHWGDVARNVSLLDVVGRDPLRFVAHWAQEAGRGLALSVGMAFGVVPDALNDANRAFRALFVALAALLGAGVSYVVVAGVRELRLRGLSLRPSAEVWLVGVYCLAYLVSLGAAFVEPRFLLALAPVLVLPPVLLGAMFMRRTPVRAIGGGLLLVFCLFLWLNSGLAYASTFRTALLPVEGVRSALDADHAAPTDPVVSTVTVPFAYGDRQHRFVLLEGKAASAEALRSLLAEKGARYFLYDDAYGPRYWPALKALLGNGPVPSYLTPLFRSDRPVVRLFRVERAP